MQFALLQLIALLDLRPELCNVCVPFLEDFSALLTLFLSWSSSSISMHFTQQKNFAPDLVSCI